MSFVSKALIGQAQPLAPPNPTGHPVLTSGWFWFVAVVVVLAIGAAVLLIRGRRGRRTVRLDAPGPRPVRSADPTRPPAVTPPTPEEQRRLPPEERATGT